MALGVAAAALKCWRGLEHAPQGPRADLTVGGEVVESEDELVALVADVGRRAITVRCWLYYTLLFTFALAFVGIQNLGSESIFFEELFRRQFSFIHTVRRGRRVREQNSEGVQFITWNILGISLTSARYTSVCVTGRTWNSLLYRGQMEEWSQELWFLLSEI